MAYNLYDYDYGNFTSTCPDGYMPATVDTADPWIHHVTASLAYVIGLFNALVIYMFLKSKSRTPVSMILLCLAISDTITAICQGLPKHFGLVFGLIEKPGIEFSSIRHEYCFFLLIVSSPLFYMMNDISMLLTTFLGLIKLLAIQFPLWFRINIKKRTVLTVVVIIALAAMAIELHPVIMFDFLQDAEGLCCNNVAFADYVYEYSVVGQWILPFIYLISFISMITSTTMIISKLFCCRPNASLVQVSDHTRAKHKKMAVNIVLITVIYLLTETMDFIIVLSPMITFVFGLPDVFHYEIFRIAIRYQRIILAMGFASNFLIYLSTGREFRQNLKSLFACDIDRRLKRTSTRTLSTIATVSTNQGHLSVEKSPNVQKRNSNQCS